MPIERSSRVRLPPTGLGPESNDRFYADGQLLGSSTTGVDGVAVPLLPPKYRSGEARLRSSLRGGRPVRRILGQHERVGLGKGPTGAPLCEAHAVHLSDLQPAFVCLVRLVRTSGAR